MSLPVISVIVISHNKRNFVLDAINSIRQQSLSRDLFEVLVVKDYFDSEIDSSIKESGFESIYTEQKSFQEKMKIGVLSSRGSVLTFLEDDDIYAENRLAVIYEEFSSDPKLIYFHNSHIPINYLGEILDRSLYYNIEERRIVKPGSEYESTILKLSRINPDFNTSTMAIRKEVFINSMDYFERITGAVDNFIFLCSVRVSGKLLFDPRKLTYYRIHSSQTIKHENFEVYMKPRDEKSINLFKSYGILLEMVENTPGEKYWKNEYYIYKSYLGIFQAANGNKDYLPNFLESIQMLNYSFISKRKYILMLVIWIYLFRLLPKVSRYPYYRYKMWELRKVTDNFEK